MTICSAVLTIYTSINPKRKVVMPFPALVSKGFTALEDSQFFQDTPISGAMTHTTDGGLVMSRRKYTRAPGRNLVTGFTEISASDKALLDQFFASTGYGADTCVYVHPITGESLDVLINSDPPYTSAYKGFGAAILWTISDFKLRTA